jgi:hypothetical protein
MREINSPIGKQLVPDNNEQLEARITAVEIDNELLKNQISVFAQLLQSTLDLLNKHINDKV